jgi:hypothetical protein
LAELGVDTCGAVHRWDAVLSVIKAVYVDKRGWKCACVGGSNNDAAGLRVADLMMVAMGVADSRSRGHLIDVDRAEPPSGSDARQTCSSAARLHSAFFCGMCGSITDMHAATTGTNTVWRPSTALLQRSITKEKTMAEIPVDG